MEFDCLYLLTVHLQETGHKPPSSSKGTRGGQSGLVDSSAKLVRGQDVWLNSGSEQTRLILRCMQCRRSFRSLPELTIHMIQTGHYQNLVQPELGHQRRDWTEAASSSTSSSSSSSSSSGSDGCEQRCHFCSEVFDDPDSLGLHIVTYGHYPKDQKLKVESSSSPPFHSPGDDKNRVEMTSSTSDLNDYTCRCKPRNLKTHQDNRQSETPKPSNTEKLIVEASRKTPHVEPGPSSSPPPPPLLPHPPAPQFLRPDDASCAQESKGDRPEEKQSALTAMQCFINRSFDQFQSTKPGGDRDRDRERGGGSGGGGGSGVEHRTAKHSPSSSSSSSSSCLQPIGGHRLTRSTHNTTSRPNRKRSQHSARRTEEEEEEEEGEGPGWGHHRLRRGRPMTGGAESWRVQAAWDEQRRRGSEGPHQPLVVISSGGQIVTSHAASATAAAAGAFFSNGRKPTHEKDPLAPNKSLQRNNGAPASSPLQRNGEPASTLDSLQELVYRQASFKGRSPTVPAYVHQTDRKPSQSQTLFISSKSPGNNSSIPETLILVNPIVTVMPGNPSAAAAASVGLGYGPGSSLSIMLSPRHSPYSKESAGTSPLAPMDPVDSDAEPASAGEFRCFTCKRSFASKGSYRYHRSRYHAYPEFERTRTRTKDSASTSGLCSRLGVDAKNKFSKYYQLANELSGKTN